MHQICIIADPSAKDIRCQLIDLSLIGLDNQAVGKEKLHGTVRVFPPAPPSFQLYVVYVFGVVFLTWCTYWVEYG